MADLSDVENVLQSTLAGWLFPTGTTWSPSGGPNSNLAASNLGCMIRLGIGWVLSAQLDTDLTTAKNGPTSSQIVVVTIFSDPGAARLMDRYSYEWVQQTNNASTFFAVASGQTVTFSGTANTSNIVGIQLGQYEPVGYRIQSTDTPATVAAYFGAALAFAEPTINGASITFPPQYAVSAAYGADQTAYTETRRQEQTFRITVWAPNPSLRTLVASFIDQQMSFVRTFQLPDGTCTNLPKGRGTFIDDVPQVNHEWRRDLKYAIEYPTIITQTQTPALFVVENPIPLPITNNEALVTESGNTLTLVSGPTLVANVQT